MPLVAGALLLLAYPVGYGFGVVADAVAPDAYSAYYYDAATPGAVLLALFEFGVFIIALALAVLGLHGRSLASMIGARAHVWRDFRCVTVALVILAAVTWPLPPLEPEPMRTEMGFGQWLGYMPLFCLALAVQTGAEEVLFRGYLQQQLARLSRSPWLWMVTPSVLFGLLHYWNHPGPNAWAIVALISVSGLIYADLTARTGNLGAAWALHFVGNFFAIAVVSQPDTLGALALWHVDLDWSQPIPAMHLMIWLLVDIVFWLTARLALRV